MTICIFPTFDRKVKVITRTTGEFLGSNFEILDILAEAIGLIPFSSFGDNREIPDDFDGPPSELDDILGEWDDWFEIENGLSTVDGLADAIEGNDEFRIRVPAPEAVVVELRDLSAQLREAGKQGAKFRLELSH